MLAIINARAESASFALFSFSAFTNRYNPSNKINPAAHQLKVNEPVNPNTGITDTNNNQTV